MSATTRRMGSDEFWRTAERARRLPPGQTLYVPPCVIAEMREMAVEQGFSHFADWRAALSRKDQA